MPPLFLRYLRGEAGDFFPAKPSPEAVAGRAREIAASGKIARIAAGQQAGLFTGPLYSMAKAAAARRAAQELSAGGIPCRGLFWIATEDHDLAEIAQATIPGEAGPETLHIDGSEKSFRPSGAVAVPAGVERIFAALRNGSETPNEEILRSFEKLWSPGRTFGEAFRETMTRLVPGAEIDWVDPLEPQWREGRLEFFRHALEHAEEIVSALDAVDARLTSAGFSPQVARGERDFPCFLIENGIRRKISFDQGRFRIHGNAEPFSAAGLADFSAREGNAPSPAALLRPVLQAWLFPVAAQVLGPSELAYHAQSAPLFGLFGLPVPVLLPRPHLLPRGARERRAQEALGLEDADIFRAREAARGAAPPVASRLRELGSRVSEEISALRTEIESVDPTLSPAAAGAAEKIAHQIDRLRDKIERASERRDEEKNRRLDAIEVFLAPGGQPADRVYSPLTYLLRFGEAFAPSILEKADCRSDGAMMVDLP